MSNRLDQERIQPSFPSTSIYRSFNVNDHTKEEKIITLPSSIDVPPVMNNPSTNDETNSSTQKTKKTRSRRTNSSAIRNKIVKGSIKNEPYTIPYSTRSQTQQQAANPTTEDTSTDTGNVIQPQVPITERKKYCAKCKESTNVVKMINSKMSRIEELVQDLKRVTNEFGHGVKNNSLLNPNFSSSSATSVNISQTKSLTSFGGIDFSKMSIGDLQNFVMLITNTITASSNATASSTEATNNSNFNTVKLEFDESRLSQHLKFETSQ